MLSNIIYTYIYIEHSLTHIYIYIYLIIWYLYVDMWAHLLLNIKNIHHLSLEDTRHQPLCLTHNRTVMNSAPFSRTPEGKADDMGPYLDLASSLIEAPLKWLINGESMVICPAGMTRTPDMSRNCHDNPMQIWSKYQSWSLGVLDGICWNTPCFGQGQTVFFFCRSLQLFAASLSSVGNIETIRRRQLLEAPSRHGIPIDVSDVWICPQIGSPFEIDQQIYTLQR